MADGGINSGNNFSRFQGDNFSSYRAFSGGMPSNIAEYGWTPEEAKSNAGSSPGDVRIAPMAATEVTEVQLALTHRTGSDVSRLASPNDPGFSPFEGPKSMLQLNRAALVKFNSAIVGQVDQIVGALMNHGAPNAEPMNESCRRLSTMSSVVQSLADMASSVQAHQAQNLS